MKTLYLCGAGNPEGVRLALKVNHIDRRWDRIALLDDDPAKHDQSILGVEIAGPFSLLGKADAASVEVSNMVARTTEKRKSAREAIASFGLPFVTLIDPDVDIEGVRFSDDITIYGNVAFCADAVVGEGAVAFTGTVIGHGSRLGPGCIIAPGAVINARVELGEGVYVGTNASILPDLKVDSWSTIGANSAVIQNVPAGATVMGVPAQILIPGKPVQQTTPKGADAVKKSRKLPAARATAAGGSERPISEGLKQLRMAQLEFLEAKKAGKA